MSTIQTLATTVTLLAASNLFMTFAWYGHLKHLHSTPWYVGEGLKWNYAWAAPCMVGAVYFIFNG